MLERKLTVLQQNKTKKNQQWSNACQKKMKEHLQQSLTIFMDVYQNKFKTAEHEISILFFVVFFSPSEDKTHWILDVIYKIRVLPKC